MSAYDTYHDTCKLALEKDGWTITDDPLLVRFDKVGLYIDLGAEKLVAAEKNGKRIAVEVKCFLGESAIADYHQALGQYSNYRHVLANNQPERELFLAVPMDVYDSFFSEPFGQASIRFHSLKLLVFSPVRETIVQWIN